MDLRQSPNYAKYMRSLGWIVENGFFIKKLWFTSIIKAQHFTHLDLEKIKKYHPFLIKLEPNVNFKFQILNFKFRKDNWPLIPSKTIILDLEKISLSKEIRYEIRKSEKNNLKIEESKSQESFYKMLQETMKLGHWEIPIKKEVINLWKSFQSNNSVLLFCHPDECQDLSTCLSNPSHSRETLKQVQGDTWQAQHDTVPVAGCLLVWHEDTAHYMYAALTKEGRKMGAAYFTLWEAIKFCQKKKLKFLDLEGICDERYPDSTKNWKGFTAFKLQWGGKIVEYPGSFTKYF